MHLLCIASSNSYVLVTKMLLILVNYIVLIFITIVKVNWQHLDIFYGKVFLWDSSKRMSIL